MSRVVTLWRLSPEIRTNRRSCPEECIVDTSVESTSALSFLVLHYRVRHT